MMGEFVAKTAFDCKNMPIAVQVATLPYQDEQCLHYMQLLEDIFKFHKTAC